MVDHDLWPEWGRYGPQVLRRKLATGEISPQNIVSAKTWLEHYESTSAASDRAATVEFAKDANDIAREASSFAKQANSLAESANSTAERAASSADKAALAAVNNAASAEASALSAKEANALARRALDEAKTANATTRIVAIIALGAMVLSAISLSHR